MLQAAQHKDQPHYQRAEREALAENLRLLTFGADPRETSLGAWCGATSPRPTNRRWAISCTKRV